MSYLMQSNQRLIAGSLRFNLSMCMYLRICRFVLWIEPSCQASLRKWPPKKKNFSESRGAAQKLTNENATQTSLLFGSRRRKSTSYEAPQVSCNRIKQATGQSYSCSRGRYQRQHKMCLKWTEAAKLERAVLTPSRLRLRLSILPPPH